MANCTSVGCGKTWDPPNGHFPLCMTSPCPLQRLQRQTLAAAPDGNIFQTSPSSQTVGGSVRVASQISESLEWHRSNSAVRFKPYDMKGAKSATTIVTLPTGVEKTFRTTDQMHSEMRATEWMLDNGHWRLQEGYMVWASNGAAIKPEEFQTTEPHCGFCMIMLLAAGLPVGKPTRGNHKLASRLAYRLPVELETDPCFIARVLDKGSYCGFPALKRVLNAFVTVPANQWVLSIYNLAYVDDDSYINPTAARWS